MGASTLPPVHDRAVLRLAWRRRRGGAARVEHPLEAFRRRRIGLPEAKGGASGSIATRCWFPALSAWEWRRGPVTPRTVRLWRRGEESREGRHPVRDPIRGSVDGSLDRTSTEKRLVFTDHHSFEHDDSFGPDARALTRLEVAQRCVEIDPRRLAPGEAAEPLDDRRGELGARHAAGHRAFALHRGRARLFPSCSRRPSGARCRAIPGAVRSSWLPSSTNCAPNSDS